MFEKFICTEALSGRCRKECYHNETHTFDPEYCNDVCSEVEFKVKCVEIKYT